MNCSFVPGMVLSKSSINEFTAASKRLPTASSHSPACDSRDAEMDRSQDRSFLRVPIDIIYRLAQLRNQTRRRQSGGAQASGELERLQEQYGQLRISGCDGSRTGPATAGAWVIDLPGRNGEL